MELKGKKINFLGDSITFGSGTSSAEHRYTDTFGRKSGAIVRTYGIGGTRIARSRHNPNCDKDCFLNRVEAMEADADIVVVFGGTNDFGHGDGVLGTPDSTDEYTFYGAINSLCRRLLDRFPASEIIFMTPLHRASEAVTTNEIGRPCDPLIRYVEVIREVAEKYSMPVLDLFACSGIVPTIASNRARYAPDGLHPNDLGAERLADRLIAFLTNFI